MTQVSTSFLRRLSITTAPKWTPSAIPRVAAAPRCLTHLCYAEGPNSAEASKLKDRNNLQNISTVRFYQSSEGVVRHEGTTSVPVEDDTLDPSTAVSEKRFHDAVTDPYEFQKAATDLLLELTDSVESMKHENDPFEVNLSQNFDVLTIDLGSDGRVGVQIDEKNKCISMESPYSGSYNYFLSKDSGKWLGIGQGHSLKGTFARDLNEICKGVPHL